MVSDIGCMMINDLIIFACLSWLPLIPNEIFSADTVADSAIYQKKYARRLDSFFQVLSQKEFHQISPFP